jgi:hypothetical protein
MEALASKKGDTTDSVTHKLALRLSRLLEQKPEQRKIVFNKIKEFYLTRSKIVHGDQAAQNKLLKDIHIDTIDEYMRKAIKIYLLKIVTNTTISHDEIIEQLDFGE